MAVKKGLGKGLDALITVSHDVVQENRRNGTDVMEVDINKIEPNKNQPRKNFNREKLEELSESIKSVGVVQPLLVHDEGGFYTIVAGERRWRAARMAGLFKVPVIIRNYSDTEKLEIALIENIQRDDLNPIEEAICFKRLNDEFFFSQEDIAGKVGKGRSYVSNSMRLLHLLPQVQEYILNGKLQASHGRVLLGAINKEVQLTAAELAADGELSVKETEKLVKKLNESPQAEPMSRYILPPGYKEAEESLRSMLGTKVSIKHKPNNKGKIEIEYYSNEELDRLLVYLKQSHEF